jgi:hypothetical protein
MFLVSFPIYVKVAHFLEVCKAWLCFFLFFGGGGVLTGLGDIGFIVIVLSLVCISKVFHLLIFVLWAYFPLIWDKY